MSHAIHKTEGVVLDLIAYKESGQIAKVFTLEHGLLSLFAEGTREQKGKLKYGLQILSLSEFDFVEGREVKRLIGAKEVNNFKNILLDRKKRKTFSNIVLLLQRLLIEEMANENLYKMFLEILAFLNTQNFSEEIEIFAVINILYFTGYWEDEKFLLLTEENFLNIKNNKEEIVQKINNAIKSTHL
jgi:DNA repair protein RecO